MYELLPVGIALNKMSGEFVESNSALLDMLGYDMQTFSELSYWDITPKAYEVQEGIQLQLLQEVGKYGPYEKEYIHKDGHHFAVLLNGIRFTDSDGEDYIWSVIQDISHIEAVKKELEVAKEKAELSSKAKSTFLANMSHEIRTPLNGVIGFIEKLQTIETDTVKLEYLDTANQSSKALLNIIKDISDISKIESNMLEIELIPFDTRIELESICKLFQALAQDKKISLSHEFSAKIPEVIVGDSLRLKQVLSNLISNAIKFTPESGHINVSVDYHNSYLEVSVIDDGIGVPFEKQQMIFDAFTQEDSSVAREYGGTGLGLHITKELVNLMGGTIHLKSNPGEGCLFVVSFKFEEGTLEEEKATVDSVDSFEGKVLVVEDNKTNRMLIEMLLEDLGIEVLMAENGAVALTLLKERSVDLVLMDINMPVMDGIEATKHIRNDAEYEKIRTFPIVALTANAIKGDRENYLAVGMNDYIEKPIDTSDLQGVLCHYLVAC